MNRSRGKHDIVLHSSDLSMGFSLARDLTRGGLPSRPAVVSSELSPARLDEVVRNADVPRVIDNLDRGMGFSRRVPNADNGYAYCLPGYTRAPGGIFCPAGKVSEITLPGPGSFAPNWIIGSERFETPAGDFLYLIARGRTVLVFNPIDGMSVTVAFTFPAGFDCQAWAVFNNRLYVSGAGGMAYLDGATGVWSAPNPAVQRSHLAVEFWRPQGIPTPVLVGVSPEFNYNALRWCPITADPMDPAAWSAPVRIGADSQYVVHRLVSTPRHVYALRPDGCYDMDELGTRTFNIAPWTTEAVDHFNGSWGLHVGTGLYYSHSQGLAFVPTEGEAQYHPEWCQPGWGLPYEGPVRGQVFAGTLHNGWGLLGQWDASGVGPLQSYVTAGRRAPDEAYGQASHIWHGAEAVVPGFIQHMRIWTMTWASGWPQLLITTTDGGTPPVVKAYWQSQSKWGTPIQEMIQGGLFAPADSASMFLPADPYDRPSAVKSLIHLEMLTERLAVNTDVLKVYAQADEETTWTEQGTADVGTYSAFAPLELTEGRFLKTRVDAIGHPILRALELRAALGIEMREARTYTVVLGYDIALKTARGREHRDPMARLLDLRTMLGQVVTLEAEYPMRVRVLQVLAPELRQLSAANRAGAWMMVVPVLVSILDHPFRWDGADHYDAGRTWS